MSVTKQRLLQRAASIIGRDELARKLGVPETLLDAWIRGDTTMPDGKLLTLAAILEQVAKPK